MQNSFKINVLVKGVAHTSPKWYFPKLRQNAASCIENMSFLTHVQLDIISEWTSPLKIGRWVYKVISWDFGPGEAQPWGRVGKPRNGPVESEGWLSGKKPNPRFPL